MRKLLASLLVGVLFIPTVQTQDDNVISSDYCIWQVRFRGLVITPDESATIDAIGGDVEIPSAVIPELDLRISLLKILQLSFF